MLELLAGSEIDETSMRPTAERRRREMGKERAQDIYFQKNHMKRKEAAHGLKRTKARAVFGNLLTGSLLSAYLYLSGMGRGGIESTRSS